MVIPGRLASYGQARAASLQKPFAAAFLTAPRTATCRQIQTRAFTASQYTRSTSLPENPQRRLSSSFLPPSIHSQWTGLTPRRSLHTSFRYLQQQQKAEDVKDTPRSSETGAHATGEADPKASSEEQQSSKSSEESESGKKEEKKEKKEQAPPPPHGDKSPWQVFADTLKTEFKASKEWNESTKALTSSAHQFTQNENVKKAKSAYEAASGAAATKTTQALLGTGKVIGKTAAWTWDTTLVKGVRASVNATGRGIDKATRPVRETKVYKSAVGGVKDAIDDGSSSRYGGWVEKEERRKQRQLREENKSRRPVEKMEEDPKYAPIYLTMDLIG